MKQCYVTFAEKKLEEKYELLKDGKFEDKKLFNILTTAIKKLKTNNRGIKIPKNVWPKVYIQKYGITNL